MSGRCPINTRQPRSTRDWHSRPRPDNQHVSHAAPALETCPNARPVGSMCARGRGHSCKQPPSSHLPE
eukprot:3031914-Alexandrium_andersonii.AAC.1